MDEEYRKKLQRLCDKALIESACKRPDVVYESRVRKLSSAFKIEVFLASCVGFGFIVFYVLSKVMK